MYKGSLQQLIQIIPHNRQVWLNAGYIFSLTFLVLQQQVQNLHLACNVIQMSYMYKDKNL